MRGLGLAAFVPVEFFDRCRVKDNHVAVTAAVLALAAPMPVLADTAATAFLALAAPPPVLAEASAAALVASAAHPTVLADAAAVALPACMTWPGRGRRRSTPRAEHSLDNSEAHRVPALLWSYGDALGAGQTCSMGRKTAERLEKEKNSPNT